MAPNTATTNSTYSYLVILRERGEPGKPGEPLAKSDRWLAVLHLGGRSYMNAALVSTVADYVPTPNALFEHYQRFPELWHLLRRS